VQEVRHRSYNDEDELQEKKLIVDKGKKIPTVNIASTVGPATILQSFEKVK
jgi:hypothetical protein